ncbi:MAG: threonine--tRNA ligase [Spirochaetales bacterium]|jgi:threonyl-tRNA synthetase|nr:threonine--tRNA ligase [Spirochaetales bacterium]
MEQKNEKLAVARQSTSHIMAEAVLRIFPDAKIAIGPAIENGFYYDFDLPRNLTSEDLAAIEEVMRSIVKEGVPFTREVVSREAARKRFAGQPYKLELLEAIPDGEEVSIYTSGCFTDLCRGPHVESAKELNPKAFKLLSIAGAYWRGDEKNKMLQRIYGTAWLSEDDLKDYLAKLEEIEKRDHRRLGKELDLFSMHEEAGPGLVYWHPKGGRIRQTIEDYWRDQHRKNGYELLYTPHIGRSWLWETSGHLGHYKENMYAPMEIDNQDYFIKPMNCPFHILIYQTTNRSYRDLPLRWAELGTVYRYERSGVLHGLLRVRGFTQDDAHIFCSPDQIENEILEVLRFSLRIWKDFGFKDIKAYLATKPKSSVGEEADWNIATESLKKAIQAEGLDFEMDEGGGAFYGPKIDLKIKDALGREWQMTTIQFDFNEPARFNMSFVDSDGKEKRPFMVHRALLGSLERFFGVLIEHYGGAFPVWLAPVQVVVIPVAPTFGDYAAEVSHSLTSAGFRAEADLSDSRMNAKIRAAQAQKVPYMLVVGGNEQAAGAVSIRTRAGEQMNNMPVDEFIKFIGGKVEEKAAL